MRLLRLLLCCAALSCHAQAAPAPLESEKSDVAKLGPMGAHWVFVQTLPAGITLFDADHGKILAGLPVADFDGNAAIAPDQKHFYTAETIWTRQTRGTRQDFLTTYDATTLDIVHETTLPTRALTVFKSQDMGFSASGHLAYIFNLTPATSVTVVDMVTNAVRQKIDTPGCGMIYPWKEGGFSSLCGDGSLLTVAIPDKGPPALSHTRKFFGVTTDPVFESSLVDPATGHALFITFTGQVFPTTLGEPTEIGTPWSLQEAAGQHAAGTGVQELAWRPGGYQVASWHKASGRLFVLMHAGNFWTQKLPGTEVWVFDAALHKLLRRIPLKLPAKGIAVSQDADPLLYAVTGDGDLAVIKAETGEELRTAKFDGGGPLIMVGGL